MPANSGSGPTCPDSPSDTPAECWCLVGNIVDERTYGEGGLEKRPGTKHFSPGTKVYCLPPAWGDGYERIKVIGRHRGSRRLHTIVIRSEWVTNWRALVVHHPEVVRRLRTTSYYQWASLDEVEAYAKALLKRGETGGVT